MRIFIFCLAFYSAIIVLSVTTSAQEDMVIEEAMDIQEPVQPDIEPAVIIEAWDIEPFERVNGIPSGSCLMVADFSNGLELAFKGKSGRLSAIRIKAIDRDLRGEIRGFVGLMFDDQSFNLQSKTNGSKADVSLLTVPAAAELILDNSVFTIRIGSDDYFFSNAGFEAGYEALLDCVGDNSLTTLKVVDHSHLTRLIEERRLEAEKAMQVEQIVPTAPIEEADVVEEVKMDAEPQFMDMPLAMALTQLIPSGHSFNFDGSVDAMAVVKWDEEGTWQDRLKRAAASQGYTVSIDGTNIRIAVDQPIGLLPDEDSMAVATDEANMPEETPEIAMPREWTANAGETVDTVLLRWARQAGVKAQIELDNPPVIAQDFVLTGAFEMAVNQLLEVSTQNRAVKPSAVLDFGDNRVTHLSGYEGGIMAQPGQIGMNRWRALQGSSLRKVLQRWSVKAGFDFLWEADEIFFIPQSVNTTTDFPEAVSLVLSQFEGQPVQPNAVLNNDPQTGITTLIIRTSKPAVNRQIGQAE